MTDINLNILLNSDNAVKNLKGFDKQSKKIFRNFSRNIDKSVGEASRSFDSFKSSFTGLLAGVGVGLGVDAFLDSIQEIETAVAEVETIAGDLGKTTGQLANEFLDFSDQFGGSAAEQAKTFYSILSAGITDTAAAQQVLVDANKLAIGGLTDVNSAVGVLTNALNVYGEQNISSTEASDILFNTVKNGVTTVGELASALGGVTGVAKDAGVGFGDVAASVATITTQGATTSEAVTRLRALFSSIIRVQSKLKNESDAVSEAFSLNALRTKSFSDFIRDLTNSVGGSQQELQRLLGSQESLLAVSALASNNAQTLSDNIDSNRDSAGAAQEAFERLNSTLERQRDLLIQRAKNFGQRIAVGTQEQVLFIFERLNQALEGSVDGSNELAKSISDFIIDVLPIAIKAVEFFANGIRSVGLAYDAIILASARLNLAIIGNLNELLTFFDTIQQRTQIFGSRIANFLASFVQDSDEAAAAQEALNKKVFELETQIEQSRQSGFFGEVTQDLLEYQNNAAESLASGIASIKETDESVANLIKNLEQLNQQDDIKIDVEVDQKVSQTVAQATSDTTPQRVVVETQAGAAPTQTFDPLGQLQDLTDELVELQTTVVEKGSKAQADNFERQKQIQKEIGDITAGITTDAREQQKISIQQAEQDERRLRNLSGQVSSIIGNIQKGAEGAGEAVSQVFGAVADSFLPGIGSAVSSIAGFLQQSPDQIREQIKAFAEAIPDIILSIVDNIDVLIVALIEAVPDLIVGIIENLPQIIEALITLLPRVAVALVQLIVQGVPRIVEAFVEFIEQGLPGAFENVGQFFEAGLQDGLNGFNTALETAFPGISEQVEKEVGNINRIAVKTREFFGGVFTQLRDKFVEIGDFLARPFQDAARQASEFFTVENLGLDGIGFELQKSLDKIEAFFRKLSDTLSFGGGGDGGGAGQGKGAVREFFGFQSGGIVPGSNTLDQTLIRATPGELVVPTSLTQQLARFLNSEGQSAPQPVQINVGGERLADVLLDLNQRGFRTA